MEGKSEHAHGKEMLSKRKKFLMKREKVFEVGRKDDDKEEQLGI